MSEHIELPSTAILAMPLSLSSTDAVIFDLLSKTEMLYKLNSFISVSKPRISGSIPGFQKHLCFLSEVLEAKLQCIVYFEYGFI